MSEIVGVPTAVYKAILKKFSPADVAEIAKSVESEGFTEHNPAGPNVIDNFMDPNKTVTAVAAGTAGGTETAGTGAALEKLISKYSSPTPQKGDTLSAEEVTGLLAKAMGPVMKAIASLNEASTAQATVISELVSKSQVAPVVKAEEPKKKEEVDEKDEVAKAVDSLVAKAEAALEIAKAKFAEAAAAASAGFDGTIAKGAAVTEVVKAIGIMDRVKNLDPANPKFETISKSIEDMKEKKAEKDEKGEKEEVAKTVIEPVLKSLSVNDVLNTVRGNVQATAREVMKAVPSVAITAGDSAGGYDADVAAITKAWSNDALSEREADYAMDLVAYRHSEEPKIKDLFATKLADAPESVKTFFKVSATA